VKLTQILIALSWALSLVAAPAGAAGPLAGDDSTSAALVSRQLSTTEFLGAVNASTVDSTAGNRVSATSNIAKLDSGFLWGVAASGFQSEGHAPDSNWTRYIAANPKYDAYGDSVDFYNQYEADIARAAALGVKVYRISIEWARLEKQPGVIDPSAVAFYYAVIKRIVKLGMRPMLTLDHWVYPGWMVDRGGWASADMLSNWLAHAKRVVDRYAPYNPIWITINEPTFYLESEVANKGLKSADLKTMSNALVAVHRSAYDYIHTKQAGAMVSSNVAFIPGLNKLVDQLFLNKVSDKLDFIGLDYYYGLSLTDFSALSYLLGTKGVWDVKLQPEGIYYAMRHYAERFPSLPLYIIETGMSTQDGVRPDGSKRSDALRDTVYWVQRAKADGMKVMGMNYWSLTDNYEWGSFTPRFGLYTVNVKTDPSLSRVPTDAVAVYADLIAAQGVPLSYKPVVAPQFCSLVDPPSSCSRPVQIKK
jgi:beta-glucosidase